DLHPLAGDEGAAHAADQLLGLAAEHDAGDDLDPAVLVAVVEGDVSQRTSGERFRGARAPRAERRGSGNCSRWRRRRQADPWRLPPPPGILREGRPPMDEANMSTEAPTRPFTAEELLRM